MNGLFIRRHFKRRENGLFDYYYRPLSFPVDHQAQIIVFSFILTNDSLQNEIPELTGKSQRSMGYCIKVL